MVAHVGCTGSPWRNHLPTFMSGVFAASGIVRMTRLSVRCFVNHRIKKVSLRQVRLDDASEFTQSVRLYDITWGAMSETWYPALKPTAHWHLGVSHG